MKKFLFTIAAMLMFGSVFSQVNGDYQTRTGASGNWNGTTIWQQFVGGVWTDVSTSPTSADGAIEVRSDASISVSAAVAVDQVKISGSLNILTGITLTVNNGTGFDLVVAGTLTRTGTGAITYSASATGSVSSGGTYVHNTSAAGLGAITVFTWDPGSTCEIRGTGAGGTLSGVNQAFHHFKINSSGISGAINCVGLLTTVNGDFTVLNTNGQDFRLTSSTNYTLAIGGNLSVSGGILLTSSSNAVQNINVTGSIGISGGAFTSGSSSLVTVTAGNGLTVNGGTFTMGSSSSHLFSMSVTGDITISSGSLTSTSSGNTAVSCTGNFNLSNTGVYQMQNSSSAGHTYTLSTGGNFNMTGGTFTGGSTSSTGTVNFTGGTAAVTYTQSAGTITTNKPTAWVVAVGKTVTLNNDLAISPNANSSVTVNGTLSCATNKVSGTGSFSLASGGTLKIGDAAGITAAIATLTGSVQTTTARTFSTGGNYEYAGSAANTGTGLPATVNSLTINTGGNVTLTNACAVTTALSLQSGKLTLGANNISAASVTNGSSSNYVVTSAAGALKINAVGASNILFPVGPSTTAYNPITINNAGTVDNFSVKVQPTFNTTPFDATKVVNMQWTVSKDGAASGNNVSLTPQWNIGDEAGSFNRAGTLVLGHDGGGTWDEISAGAVAGTYTTTATGVSSFSPFGVGNVGAFFSAAIANVALASDNPAEPAANIGQGLAKFPIYSFNLAVTTNATILTQVDFTTASSTTYAAADITKLQLWYSLTNDINTATQIGADITTGLGIGAHSFTGLGRGIANGATAYFWITTDVAASGISTPGNTINVPAIGTADLSLAGASKSGTAFAGNDQTILAPSITLASPNPSVPATNLGQGDVKKLIYNFTAASAGAIAILDQVNFTTGGTYVSTDVTRFRLWYNATNNFATATQLGADITTSLGAGSHSFGSSLGRTIANAATGNFWITVDIDPAAVTGNTVNVAAILTTDLTFRSGGVSGTAFAGGDQTIITPSGVSDDFRAVANGDWSATSTWQSSPAGTGTWHTSTLQPTSAATSVAINGYSVTVSTAVTAPNTTTDNASTLSITTGGSIAIGASKTVNINGILNNAVTGTPITYGASAVLNVGASGVYNLTADGGQVPNATWNAASVINITGIVTGGLSNTANSTYGNYIYNCVGQTTGTVVLFSQAGINIAGNFTIGSTGTGLAQIISSGGTNLLTVGGNYIQHGGIALFNPSNTATTVRSMVVLGNFTIDDATSAPTFRLSNGTATASLVIKGNVSLTNATLENTSAAGNSNCYFAGTNQSFSKTGGTTTVTAGTINFTSISGNTLDLGSSIVTGSSFSNSGPYTFSAINGTTSSGSATITGVTSVAGLQPGMAISGTGIPANSYITSVNVVAANNITISKLATASGTVALTLSGALASTLKIGDAAGITSSGATGNVQVTGARNFNTAANYEYNGSVAQVTGNGLPASVNNLNNNNTAGVTLSAPVTVNNLFSFSNGILTTDATNILTIASTGSYVGGGASTYVNGPMNMNVAGPGSYNFPVGKGGVYHTCTVNPTAAGSYQAEYFNAAYSDLTIDGSLQSVSNLEYWDIRQLAGTSASVSLSLNGTAIPGGTPTNVGVVAHYTGATWTSENAAGITPGDATSGTALSNTLNSFSPFTFGTVSAPTPLTLLSFNGSMSNGLVKLTWLTSNEINVRNFVIERSADGRNFSSIGTVNAINGPLTNLYSFNDVNAINGIAYYRLQMVDRDGKFKYSSIIAFNSKKADVLSIFPNPVKDDLFVTHAKAVAGASIELISMDGKKLASQSVAKNAVQTTINTNTLPAGVYQLVYVNGNNTEHMRFIKQ